VSAAAFLFAYVVGGYRQAIEGVTTLVQKRELDVDLLMVVAAIGAAAIGFWFDGALLIVISALSGTLEGYASARTKNDIEALMALHPDEAVVMRDGVETVIAASTLVVGDVVIVRPGERISADGHVTEGTSAVNPASITGESLPVDKRSGDEVFAGTINGQGALRVVASRAANETVLARIVELVKQAEERRPPAQLFIERFERGYAKVVVAGGLLMMAVPPLLLGWSFRAALYRAMIFLVVASPCETLGRVRAVAIDKTGTMTTGVPRITDLVAFDGSSDELVLARAAAVESLSEHPLGRAIVAEAKRRGVSIEAATNHQAIAGRGAHADVGGARWRIGKPSLFDTVPADVLEARERLEAEGKTVVVVGDDRVRGLVALQDTIRPEARDAIAQPRKLGVEHIIMLTGDAEPTARAIARRQASTRFAQTFCPRTRCALSRTSSIDTRKLRWWGTA
jgi:Cd2+/Zn2+-exporting ATPase